MNLHLLIMVATGLFVALVLAATRCLRITLHHVHVKSGRPAPPVRAERHLRAADRSKETEHLFFLYFHSAHQALAAAADIAASSSEHEVELEVLAVICPREEQPQWSLCLTMQLPPDSPRLGAVSDWLMAMALPHDGDYDGNAIVVTE